MAKAPPLNITITPVQTKPTRPKGSGISNSEWVREAANPASGVTQAQALAGITQNYRASGAANPAQAAAAYITSAPKPSPAPKAPYTGPNASDILAAAKNTNTPAGWAKARAALLLVPNYSPGKADVQITNAQNALAAKKQAAVPKIPKSTITSTLSPASTPAAQAAAAAKLVQTGNAPDLKSAEYIVHQTITPTPNVPSLDWVLKSLQLGTLTRDQASVYFAQLGTPPKLEQQYLATAKATYDKWVVLGADGRLKYTPITSETNPPSNVLKYGPTPLTQTSFMQVWTQTYKDQFFNDTGRQATGQEVQQILAKGITPYALANGLAQNKPVNEILGNKVKTPAVNFQSSPTYKQHAGSVIAYAKSILGQNWKPDQKLIGQALAQSWDQAKLDGELRKLPAYLHGPEFQDGSAKKAAVWQTIYGVPTAQDLHTIGQAQLQGWTDDEFAQYLRAQPQYTKSPEYLSKILTFGQALGLITGQQPGLVTGGSASGQPMQNPNPPSKLKVADNPRLPAPGSVQSPINYVPSGVG